MRDRELYGRILGISAPWRVTEVALEESDQRVVVFLEHGGKGGLSCPECGQSCPGYDALERRWRHLDTCQFQTILVAQVPRCSCPQHGVRQVAVPWADEHSRFTALFEAVAIDWMQEAGRAATARRMRLSWDEADGIMRRAVARGLARRQSTGPTAIGVDEKSFQKGHEYVTVVCDLDRGVVLYVGDNRSQESLDGYYQTLPAEHKQELVAIAMDMCQAYVASTLAHVPGAAAKIVFDKFHIAKQLGEAVDRVRRQENQTLCAADNRRLVGTRYHWLRNPLNETKEQARAAASLRRSNLQTARAWRLKETMMDFWTYRYAAPARAFFERWYAWAIRSRLAPIKRVARALKSRLQQLLNSVRIPITNAMSESLNAKIQWIKHTAHGFKTRVGFKTAIYFHCGGLDLYPVTHRKPG